MSEQTFKNLDDIMFQEPGCNSELDYAEQSSWMLFLKYLDDLEESRALEARIDGKPNAYIFEAPYRWASWSNDGTKTDTDLVDFGMLSIILALMLAI